MDISSITNQCAAYTASNSTTKKSSSSSSASQTDNKDTAVVYEKSSSSSTTKKSATYTDASSNAAIVAQMKADAQNRYQQLQDLVQKTIAGQGNALASSNDIWSYLASGKLKNVDQAAVEQAQKDIAEDGYWGADQTSDRILSFAQALSGGDSSKADKLLDAFKKGYDEATKTWGKSLPSLCSDTYDMVEEKFNKWKNNEDA